MTKQQRSELREINRRITSANGNLSRTLARCGKARRVSDRDRKKAITAATRQHERTVKELEREERFEAKVATKTTKSLLARKAILEGRLAS